MTSQDLETHWLSLRYWLTRCVLPSAVTLCALLLLLPLAVKHPQYRDQTAAILGFFTLYFVLFRAGHVFMIRSMHFDLKTTYGEAYELRLRELPANLHRKNLGFTLAKIKRELIDAAAKR